MSLWFSLYEFFVHLDHGVDACYDRGAPLFSLILPLNLGAQDLSQKLMQRKIKLLHRMKNAMAY